MVTATSWSDCKKGCQWVRNGATPCHRCPWVKTAAQRIEAERREIEAMRMHEHVTYGGK